MLSESLFRSLQDKQAKKIVKKTVVTFHYFYKNKAGCVVLNSFYCLQESQFVGTFIASMDYR